MIKSLYDGGCGNFNGSIAIPKQKAEMEMKLCYREV